MERRIGLVPVDGDAVKRGALTAAPIRAPAWLRYVLVVLMGLAAVMLFLLATAAANTQLFAQQYPCLLYTSDAADE